MNLSTNPLRSFEDHMSLYASYNVQEAALRAQQLKHLPTSGRKQNTASLLHRAALRGTVASLLALLMDQLLNYVY